MLLLGIILFRADTERLQQTHQTEMRSLRADAQRLEEANRLAEQVYWFVGKFILSFFYIRSLRADTERLQQTHETEMRSLRADAQRLEEENRLAEHV